MKTRYLVYIVRAARTEYVCVAGVFYGFSRDPKYPLQLNDWQADYHNFYGKSSFKTLKEIQKFHGHSKVEKVIKTGVARSLDSWVYKAKHEKPADDI